MASTEHVLERDWSQLLADLLTLVFGTLEVPELLNAAAICRSWRYVYKLDPRLDASPLFRGPCLTYSAVNLDAATVDMATLQCLLPSSVSSSETRDRHHITLPSPPFCGRHVIGSAHDWLATADEHYVLYHMDLESGSRNNVMFKARSFLNPDEARYFLYRRVAISVDLSTGNDDCIVIMIIHLFQDQLSFARIGDVKWMWIHGDHRYSQ
ncbi:hypothetical protein PR202_ga23892 [Eleusine coracana subsp. coracana]|uniref:KIB1-4 beta-propeller domain-containing protein n=1 Tax=Eleusine coracana subsp. coracana TaxID=191504 RepID=A0AAV5D7Q8_ELECO|nr:hypothetical protein PR202_ga23892 [Eleusine coracana subsp. coracana]